MLNRFGILAVCGVAALVGCSSSSASGDGDGGIVRDGDGSLITDDGGVWRDGDGSVIADDGDGSVIADDGGIAGVTDASLLDDGGVVNTALRVDTNRYLRTVILNAAPGRIVLNGLDLAPVTASNLTPAELAELGSMALSGSGSGETIGEETRKILAYAYSCALPASSSMQLEIGGETWEFQGALGLAPEWETGPCETECQEWVSACLLARTNQFGLPVALSLRGDHPALANVPAEVARQYSLREGSFYGNVFTATDSVVDHAYACAGGKGGAMWELTNRYCSVIGDGCPITTVADCNIGEFACDSHNTGCSASTACSEWNADGLPTTCHDSQYLCGDTPTGTAYTRIITAFIEEPAAQCGNGICEEGENDGESDDCAADCSGHWAFRYGSGCHEDSAGLSVHEATGNISIAGRFIGEINFVASMDNPIKGSLCVADPANGRLCTTGDDDTDLFVTNFDSDGALNWSLALNATGAQAMIRSIVNDSSGNVIVAGHFSSTINLGDGDVTPSGMSYFVAKYAAGTGAHIWSQVMETDATSWSGILLDNLPMVKAAVDSNDGVVLALNFRGTVNLGLTGGGPNGNPETALLTNSDILVTRFDSSGARSWHKQIDGSSSFEESVQALALDSGDNVVLAGLIQDANSPEGDGFVAKLSPIGDEIWVKHNQSATEGSDSVVVGLAIGANDDIAISGNFSGETSLMGETAIESATTPQGTSTDDAFVAKLDSDGLISWTKFFGDNRQDSAKHIAWNGSDSYVVASLITTGFDTTVTVEGTQIDTGEKGDVVLIRYDSAGVAQSVTPRGGPVSEAVKGLVANGSSVVLAGQFMGTLRFSGTYLTNAGGSSEARDPMDIFVTTINNLP